jgi:hypothetical protein
MVDQNLLTIFIALTAVAVLIQAGILVGFYFLSTKLSRQADQALDITRNLLGPVHTTAQNLEAVTARLARLSAVTQEQLRQFTEHWWKRREA